MYYIKDLKVHTSHVIKYCRTYIRTRNIYIMDHELISPDIDGSCDVYSSLTFAYPLAENGLLICVFI